MGDPAMDLGQGGSAPNAGTPGGGSKWLEHRNELVSVVLMSLASLGSAWCAYESSLWSGRQFFALAAANAIGRQSSQKAAQAEQVRVLDAALFVQFAAAYSQGDGRLAEFLLQRFRPEMKAATEAWIRTTPIGNPDAPATPFRMSEYAVPQDLEAQTLASASAGKGEDAQQYNRTSDRYVLMTVLFSVVLFFSGLATKFDSRRAVRTMLWMAGLILVCSFIVTVLLPVAWIG